MTHFHALFGIPTFGLEWTDDVHSTPREAWDAVHKVLIENWKDEVAKIGDRMDVDVAYRRGAVLCILLEEPGRFHVPALSLDDPGLTYGVVACDDAHRRVA